MLKTRTKLRSRIIAVLVVVWVLGSVACGGGGTIVVGGNGQNDGATTSTTGEQLSLVGTSVMLSQTKSYEILISVGEALDVPVSNSTSGVYEIRSTLNF